MSSPVIKVGKLAEPPIHPWFKYNVTPAKRASIRRPNVNINVRDLVGAAPRRLSKTDMGMLRRPTLKNQKSSQSQVPFKDVRMATPSNLDQIHPYNYRAFLSITPDQVKDMNRFQREIYRKHNDVYSAHETELKQIKDDYDFKMKANATFKASHKSDLTVNTQLNKTFQVRNESKKERTKMKELGQNWTNAQHEHRERIARKVDSLVAEFERIEERNVFLYGRHNCGDHTKQQNTMLPASGFRVYAKAQPPLQSEVKNPFPILTNQKISTFAGNYRPQPVSTRKKTGDGHRNSILATPGLGGAPKFAHTPSRYMNAPPKTSHQPQMHHVTTRTVAQPAFQKMPSRSPAW